MAALLAGLCLTRLHSYLLFHSLAELFSVIVGCAIFMLAWNGRHQFDSAYLLFIGIAYLFVGGVDMVHVLAYKGMGGFRGHDANLPTQLWIVARGIEGLSLLVAPLFLGRKVKAEAVVLIYGALSALLLVLVFTGMFPTCFVEGEGLTPFKRVGEYAISLILAASIVLLTRRREKLDRSVFALITASVLVTIASELAFTFYTDPFGPANMAGHCLKLVSFYLIYRAVIVFGLRRPYEVLFRELRSSEARYRSVVEDQTEFIVRYLPNGTCTFVNDSYCRASGQSRDALTGASFFALIPEDDREAVRQKVRSLTLERPVAVDERRAALPDGTIAWQRWTDRGIFDDSGRLVEVQAVGFDVTEHRRAEEALKAEKEFTEAALNAQMDTFFVFDPATGQALRWNEAFRRVSGYSGDEIRSLKAPDSYYSEEDIRKAAATIEGVLEHGTETVALSLITRDGRSVPTEYVAAAMQDDDGSPKYIIAIGRDITERRRAEEALRKAHDELERRVEERTAELARAVDELRVKDSAIASSLNGIGITDMTGKLVYANDALVRMWGYDSADEILGRDITGFWEGDGVLRTLEALRTTGRAAGEDTGRKKDGSPFPVEFTATVIHDDKGEPSYLFGSFVDITERKRAEEALRASERALTVSRDRFRRLAARLLTAQEEESRRLARELHDDLSQRMAVLTIDAGKLEMQMAAGEGPDAETVRSMRERLARLSEDIRDISRELHPSILEHLGLVDALRTECTTVAQREGIQIDYHADGVPEGLSRNAALCLYRIAQEALRNVVRHARTDRALVSLASMEDAVVLTVEDRGAGFDPAEAGGTVGLASMTERARLVHGELTITSRPGHGTTVRATVPLRKETP